MIISSATNPTIKRIKQLLTSSRQRTKHALSVLEGVHLIDACLKASYPIQQILVAQNALEQDEVQALIKQITSLDNEPKIDIIDDTLYQQIRTLGTGVDIMAVIAIKQSALPIIDSQDCLILNDVQDSGNVGTLMRTAAAVGINTVICSKATAQAWSPKTMRAGMGAQFSLNIYEQVAIQDILDNVKVPMYATSSHTDKVIYQQDLSQPVAWVMGNEGQGVCDAIMTQATPITIPQPNGQESLNVAIAGALCMYELVRQRLYP